MKKKLDFSLNYEAQFEISNIRLELDRGYEGDSFMYYKFDVGITCAGKSYVIEVSQSMCFIDMEPPAEDIFPESDVRRWRFCDSQNPNRGSYFEDLSDIEKNILQEAVESACNAKDMFKQAYKKFWSRYIQDKKESALRQLTNAERLKEKLDNFLRTIEG